MTLAPSLLLRRNWSASTMYVFFKAVCEAFFQPCSESATEDARHLFMKISVRTCMFRVLVSCVALNLHIQEVH